MNVYIAEITKRRVQSAMTVSPDPKMNGETIDSEKDSTQTGNPTNGSFNTSAPSFRGAYTPNSRGDNRRINNGSLWRLRPAGKLL